MKLVLLILCVFGIAIQAENKSRPQPAKRKIVVAWSKGGGAHKSMLDALREYLKDDYELIAFNPLERIYTRFDLVRFCSGGHMDGEDLYNCLLARDLRWIINKMFFCGTASMRRHTRYLENQIERYFRLDRPDLVISVIPILNYALNEVGRRLNIPFLMIAPDCDTSHYLTELYPTRPFYCTLPFDDALLKERASEAWIAPHFVKEYGFPLRKNFFEPKNRKEILEHFGLSEDKPLVMILMGATGSSKALEYLKHLNKVEREMHIIICIGRNAPLRQQINKIRFPPHITHSTIGFTKRIADLMYVSDVLITKAGASTLCEAIEMQVPLIIDQISTPLEIERLQPEFVKKHKMGEILTDYKHLPRVLDKLLSNKKYAAEIRQRMRPFSQKTFPARLKALIAHILDEAKKNRCTPEGANPGLRWLRS